jgi:high-affinity nickel permease
MFKILLTIYSGLEHAFEADHLLAVNTLVSHRENLKQSLKDGVFWGIGHTTTIFFVGILMIGFKFNIGEDIF